MIANALIHWRNCPGFAGNPVWERAFEWIENNAASAAEGIHPLGEGNMFVRVMAYDLKERDDANYESHLHTIDLQFTIKGAERIEYTPVNRLQRRGKYLEDKDFQFYNTPEMGYGRVDNREGQFCVLFPEDGHMPQLKVPGFSRVIKLVVKIPVRCLVIQMVVLLDPVHRMKSGAKRA